jgi:predicted transposase YdaD
MVFDEYIMSDTLKEIIRIDPAIAKAQRRLEEVMQNEEFRQNYRLRQKALSDWTTGVNTAVEKKTMDIARKALAEGLPVNVIQKITGLSLEDINSLQTE